MRKLLAYMFLFMFSFQVLPVKQLGKMLFKGQLTEEIHETSHEGGDDNGKTKLKKLTEYFPQQGAQMLALGQYHNSRTLTAIHQAERLPMQHVADIFAPPPNNV